jgi:YD repeat-containing protein
MSKEPLTHSEKYVKKTNAIILIIGLSSLVIFIFGLVLLLNSNDDADHYEEPVFTENADVFGDVKTVERAENIEFSALEEEIPLTVTPDPIPMGEVVLGTEAKNVLTLGTNGKAAVRIVSVELADPPAAGFTFQDNCSNTSLTGDKTCHITMSWNPVVAGNVQNNFIISWHELNLGKDSVKAAKVPVVGTAVTKEECNYCESTPGTVGANSVETKAVRLAIGPDGKVIGDIDEDGFVKDADGNIIGKVGQDGLIMGKDGNVIGVAENRRQVYDEFGNLIGAVMPDGSVVDADGKVIGRALPDDSVVDLDGKTIGRAVETGFVYDENGNILGRGLPDGSVADLKGNVIGRVLADGTVVDLKNNT